MDLIMFYSGKVLPEYLQYTFKQVRLFNPNITIHFLTDKKLMDNQMFIDYNISVIDKSLYYSEKVKTLELLYKRESGDFWMITTTRLVYFENYIRQNGLTNVYHFENDILIYFDFEKHDHRFKALCNRLFITIGGPDKAITGFMFIKDANALEEMMIFFIRTLIKNGNSGTKKKYKLDMVNEMTLMRAFGIVKGKNYLNGLPIMPFGEQSEYYPLFDSIFDPASWGQYVGGNIQEKIPGLKPRDHYIGQMLQQHPDYTVIWKRDAEGRNIPYFKYDDNEVQINNLHIHSKELEKYIS